MKDNSNPIPYHPLSKEEIIRNLSIFARKDSDPLEGKVFAYVYETGLEELKEIAHIAYNMFVEKNALDFTVFPSVIKMESEIIKAVSNLLNGDEEVSGIFTSGGTESNILAVYSARNYYRKKHGTVNVPEVIMPITAHPSFDKAGDYLGMRVRRIPIDPDTMKVDPDTINEVITNRTAVVVASAPDWPFGIIDPIPHIAEITGEKDIWFHVDACLGGFILPFLKRLGMSFYEYDFSVEGIYSISTDLHKYGYVPKGASTLLFKNRDLKTYSIFAYTDWPGYIFINPTMLSSRSLGPVAASWAVMNYLGVEGYMNLAKKILRAKDIISKGFEELGFRLLGGGETVILAYTIDYPHISIIVDKLSDKGWHLQSQPGYLKLNIPPNIHLTIMPIHEKTAEKFIQDLKVVFEEAKRESIPDIESLVKSLRDMDISDIKELLGLLGMKEGEIPKETIIINELIRRLPREITETVLKYFLAHLY